MKEVSYSLKVYDNIIEIIPDEPILSNHAYEIEINQIQAAYKSKKLDLKGTFFTEMTPSYCSLEGVKSLVDAIELPDDKTLYYIREASRKAEYVSGTTFDRFNPPFQVNQYVKYKAAHDTLLKFMIDRATMAGYKGKMGEIEFDVSDSEKPLKTLLDMLNKEFLNWEDEIKGEDIKKGASPKAVVMRSNPSYYGTKVHGFGREVTR